MIINIISGVCAMVAAGCWARVACIQVPNAVIDASRTNLDDVTVPLAKQGKWNGIGAAFAAAAAIAQVIDAAYRAIVA